MVTENLEGRFKEQALYINIRKWVDEQVKRESQLNINPTTTS